MAALTSIIDELTDLAKDIGVLGEERTRDLETTHTPTSASTLVVETKNGATDVHPTEGDDLDADFTLSAKTGKATVEGLTCLVDESSRTYVTGELGEGGPPPRRPHEERYRHTPRAITGRQRTYRGRFSARDDFARYGSVSRDIRPPREIWTSFKRYRAIL